MAPNPTALSESLQQIVHYHLDNGSLDNALFFAERLVALDIKAGAAIQLYALCHLRMGDFRSAYDVSKATGYRGMHLGTTWVFAQACLALERHKDGIVALEKSRGLWTQKCSLGKHSCTSRAEDPDLPALLCLLGKLHRAYGDKRKAVSCFEEAIKKNPFMWDAFTALCDMGINVRVPNVFKANDLLVHSLQHDVNAVARDHGTAGVLDVLCKRSAQRNPTDLMDDPFAASSESPGPVVDMFAEGGGDFASRIQNARLRGAMSSNSSQLAMEGIETPTGTPSLDSAAARPGYAQEPPQAPGRKMRNAQAMDSGAEAPLRINYRLGAKRNGRAHERGPEQPVELMTEAANVSPASMRSGSLGTADRKRTLSGHPVHRATTHAEEPPMRRSARLNMFKPLAKSNAVASAAGASAGRELKKARPPVSRILRPGTSSVGRVVSGNRKPLEDHGDIDHGEMSRVKEMPPPLPIVSRLVESDTGRTEEVLRWIFDLLKRLGNGYYALSRFQCLEALQALSGLPPAHQTTPWVLSQMGRAHYEQASYAEAEKFFRRLRIQAPSRLQDMEVYSTILWHLKRETDLSFLAHELVDAAWHSPQAWCALGNAWSLARDPEQALKCFRRATQLDPKFAYAFTLQGHEHVSNEEYDKALTAYRQAIAADRRHYNAYYGIGRVQERLGAYDRAHEHFYAAQIINPNNAVLICCMGTVLEKQNNMAQALAAYTKAAELAPRAAQTRYKKARALLSLEKTEEARRELLILKDLAPEEATVHFLLGTLYRRTNEKQLSVRHYTIALSLDPKAAPKIKDAIERLEDDDVSMDDSMIA
ncbi:hypothetical protein CDD82_6263 [Ophiocordyceps australis]|uniref:Protein bimA n=1 Tax=Ophiocordyceps australis TaxID=1399860 RepID=A0A2C5ZSM9_9HYPO|nr:hypothetical protein CDD82_6263 [Ophiocordyceps australis]